MPDALPTAPLAPATPGTRGPTSTAAPRLLFLFADTGGGHRAAAAAVAAELARLSEGSAAVTLVDPFRELAPPWLEHTVALYAPLIRRAPRLWGALYHATDTLPGVTATRTALSVVAARLRRLVASLRPAVVVSFHPLLSHPAVAATAPLSPRPQVATVVTDLTTVHRSWVVPGSDLVVVPSATAAATARAAGIIPTRVHVAGVPVSPAFRPPTAAERTRLRRLRGLRADAFVALAVGGAEGSGHLDRVAATLLGALPDAEVVVVCGRNHRLRRRLLHSAPARLHVLGYVDDMPQWMACADVCATKAGPATITEALCTGVPLLLTSHLPGQETANVAWVVRSGAGWHVPTPELLARAARRLADPHSGDRLALRAAALRAARPGTATTIAHDLLCLATGAPRHPATRSA